ncbi:glutathione S-transferase [Fennellomyces sp. T-0311]|nr:glutathione S-transferase [Fennellomyces sp. T-0311]
MSSLNNLKLTYFNYNRTGGFGENIKLLLEDQQIPHEYVQVERTPETWDTTFKQELTASDLPFDCLPFIETQDGKRFFSSTAILRFLAKKLGMLDGLSDEDEEFLDAIQDLLKDWYIMFAVHIVGSIALPEKKVEFLRTTLPSQVARFERLLGVHGGPYILGSKISHVDYFLFHTVDDQRPIIGDLKAYPRIAKFLETFEERPNIKKYLATLPPKQIS